MEYTSLVYYVFMDFVARPNFAKTKRGASGGFLPRPLLLRLRHPNSEKNNQPKFCGILSPENCFRKTSSALFQISSSGLLSKKVRILYNEYRQGLKPHLVWGCKPWFDGQGFEGYNKNINCFTFLLTRASKEEWSLCHKALRNDGWEGTPLSANFQN